MKETLKDHFITFFKTSVPLLSSLVWMLVCLMPVRIPLFQIIKPDVGLACLYFWILCFDHAMGAISAIILGLSADILSGVVIGTNICVFLVVYVATKGFAIWVNAKPFIINWAGFAVICLGAMLLKWVMLSVYHHHLLPIMYVTVNFLETVLLYPLIVKLNLFVYHRYLLDDEAIHEQG